METPCLLVSKSNVKHLEDISHSIYCRILSLSCQYSRISPHSKFPRGKVCSTALIHAPIRQKSTLPQQLRRDILLPLCPESTKSGTKGTTMKEHTPTKRPSLFKDEETVSQKLPAQTKPLTTTAHFLLYQV